MDKPREVNSAISTKKCSKAFAEYIWDSPCLKPFFFNPFLLAIVIIMMILIIDTVDGKYFEDTSSIFLVQHTFSVFIAISGLLVINNMLIKHKYRQEKEELKSTIIVGDNNIDNNVDNQTQLL